jgi:hypothetical protein
MCRSPPASRRSAGSPAEACLPPAPTRCLQAPYPFAKGALLPHPGRPARPDDLAVVAELVDAQR